MRGRVNLFLFGAVLLGACGPAALEEASRDAGAGDADGGETFVDEAGTDAGQQASDDEDAPGSLTGDVYEASFDGGDGGGSDGEGDGDGDALISEIDHELLIEHFGGVVVDAFAYDADEAGFQQYLDDVGVVFFSANEIVSPNNPEAAAECGYTILLPERAAWEKIGALALMSDQLRALVGEPVVMRNWWRPSCYNALVGGAAGGDHPDADAVDLDFQSAASRAAAQQYLCEGYWQQDFVAPEEIAPGSDLDPRLNMSIGLGGATIHLGLLSANGRRFWKYASYTEEPGSGSCW